MDRAVAPVSSCTQQNPGSQHMFHIAWSRWLRGLRTRFSGNSGRRKTARPMRLQCEALEDRSMPSTFTVLNTLDSGAGSLRQAILASNASVGIADTIAFDIGGGGQQTIRPASALPIITDSVTIDGTTQGGYAGSPLIELNGGGAGDSSGLYITAGNSTVRG